MQNNSAHEIELENNLEDGALYSSNRGTGKDWGINYFRRKFAKRTSYRLTDQRPPPPTISAFSWTNCDPISHPGYLAMSRFRPPNANQINYEQNRRVVEPEVSQVYTKVGT